MMLLATSMICPMPMSTSLYFLAFEKECLPFYLIADTTFCSVDFCRIIAGFFQFLGPQH